LNRNVGFSFFALDRPGLAQQFFLRQVAVVAAANDDDAGIKALRLSGATAFLAELLNRHDRSGPQRGCGNLREHGAVADKNLAPILGP
jgi:hypothetical protein